MFVLILKRASLSKSFVLMAAKLKIFNIARKYVNLFFLNMLKH